MLITLQSNSDSDASNFFNYFKETIVIKPNSEIALVNCSYNYEGSITVNASNNTFQVQLGKDDLRTITLTIGSYTPESFLQELTDSITTFFTATPYEVERAFRIEAVSDGTNVLTLNIDYSPEEWQVLPVEKSATTDRTAIELSNADMMDVAGDGIITQTDTTGGLDLRKWNSGASGNLYPIWGTATDVELEPHGSYLFSPQQNDATLIVALEDGVLQSDISDSAIQVSFSSLTLDILERNSAGIPQSILTTPISYNAFDEFEIRIEQINSAGGEKVRYFKNSIEIITPISSTADRFIPRKESKLICAGSFDSAKVDAKVVGADGTYRILDCLVPANITITSPGSGYSVGEVVNIPAVSGEISTARVDSVDGNGGILTFTILQSLGSIAGAGETITLIGQISGANNATITTGVPADSATLVAGGGGTAYSLGLADILLNDGITTVVGAVDIITLAGTGVSDFTWQDLLEDQVSIGDILTIVQGTATDATITINCVESDIPSVAGVKWTTISSTLDEPLLKQSQALFKPSAGFQSLTSLAQKSGDADPSLSIVGTSPVIDGKETDQMLVNIEEFQIKSICKEGGIQKAVQSVPFGERENTSGTQASGYFFYEPGHLMYHQLENHGEENNNQLRVRLTDAVGNPLTQLKHKTTITLDLRPRAT